MSKATIEIEDAGDQFSVEITFEPAADLSCQSHSAAAQMVRDFALKHSQPEAIESEPLLKNDGSSVKLIAALRAEVERLNAEITWMRSVSAGKWYPPPPPPPPTGPNHYAGRASLCAEIERLTQRNDELRTANGFAELEAEIERLRDALSISACPYVASGHTGDGTVKACIDAGECGCVNKAALRR